MSQVASRALPRELAGFNGPMGLQIKTGGRSFCHVRLKSMYL